MQLSSSGRAPTIPPPGVPRTTGTRVKPRGFIATGVQIVHRETPLALYKGLGAVLSGIVPKMAIRFASFETYKGWMADEDGRAGVGKVFVGG